jgi:hypothetical protein
MSRDISGRSASSRAKLGEVIASPVSFAASPRDSFRLARLAEHAAQLPDALGVIGQPHAVLGLFEFELNLSDSGVAVTQLNRNRLGR